MTHLTNDPTTFKDDWVDGLVAAYPRYVERVPGASGVQRCGGGVPGRVSVVIGGGCGHYPAFAGTVGAGFATAAVIGDVFTSPSTEQAYRVGRAVDGGAGVLFSFGNYAGDVMNFGVAEQRLRADGVDCRTVLVTDDVASAPVDEIDKRRGIAGDFTVFKVAGAAAERGDDLDAVERLARLANDRTRTLGVAFGGCTVPGGDEPLFVVAEGQMEIGLGIHGEPGIRETSLATARDLVPLLLDPLLEEAPEGADGRVAVLVNGLGATKYEELFCLSAALFPALAERGLDALLPEIGELVTSLDMAGCSLTLTWLDDELAELWSAPTDTPAFRRGDVAKLDRSRQPVRKQQLAAEPPTTKRPAELDGRQRACTERVVAVLAAMLAVVAEGEAELGRIDAVAGDGDHGSGMVRGLSAAVAAAESARDEGRAGDVALSRAGAAWADKAGGTSGALWGAILTAFGSAVGDRDGADDALVAGVRAAADAVVRLGRCVPGDKTMLDALLPFADTLAERLAAGSSRGDAWRAAAARAADAAQATTELRPRVGRARPLADRSIGTPDPGALSMAWCLAAMTEQISEEDRS